MSESTKRKSLPILVFSIVIAGTGLVTPARGVAGLGDCSQPVTNGSAPVATDCLFMLTVAVGLDTCDPQCICSPTGSSTTVAADALACLIAATGGGVVLDCPCGSSTTTTTASSSTSTSIVTTSSTTTTLGAGAGCPDTVEITAFAGAGAVCDSDDDCPAGACDLALARCRTVTSFDFGWSGIGHDMDTHDADKLVVRLACGEEVPCGVCSLEGIDPANRLCRCEGDNRAICDEPFLADQDDCGGGICNCYQGPPLPLSAGNTPTCFVRRFTQDIAGTIDVDAGDLAMTAQLRISYYRGDSLVTPCGYCVNDALAADGVRDGTCVVGANAGMDCDVDAINFSFPAPGGAGHSLDCFPDAGKNISGAGLVTNFSLGTGPVSLPAAVDCTSFAIPLTCHCGVCSSNFSLTCLSNADCEALDAGTCGKRANFDPKPNGCMGAAGCTESVDGDAICDEGPVDRSCDGIVRSDGEGVISCASNVDCEQGTIGVDAGACTLARPRECFLPTIDAEGSPDPDAPVAAALYCAGPSSGSGFNALWGIVGPARLVSQLHTSKLCGGPDGAPYVEGVGCNAPVE